jgi:hypothetical protein
MADSNSFRVKQTPDSGLSFYGANGRGNNVSIDGGESNDAGGGVRPTVSQEAVMEFQINRTNYLAEHGEARGGVIDVVTKGGSNVTHGSVFGFFRNQSLDATDPFAVVLNSDNRLVRVHPDSSRQQFGATVGGPIAKDRTFYFLSFEDLCRRESNSVPVLTDLFIFYPRGSTGYPERSTSGTGRRTASGAHQPAEHCRDVQAQQRHLSFPDRSIPRSDADRSPVQ